MNGRYYFFVFAHTPQKGDNIHQANVLRILHFFRSVLSSDSRERHFLVHSRRPRLEVGRWSFAQAASFLGLFYTIDQPRFAIESMV